MTCMEMLENGRLKSKSDLEAGSIVKYILLEVVFTHVLTTAISALDARILMILTTILFTKFVVHYLLVIPVMMITTAFLLVCLQGRAFGFFVICPDNVNCTW